MNAHATVTRRHHLPRLLVSIVPLVLVAIGIAGCAPTTGSSANGNTGATGQPTATTFAGESPVAIATDTPLLAPTQPPFVAPTDTPLPLPTDTPVPAPTDTPAPAPTDTPVPLASASVSNITLGNSPISGDASCYMQATVTNTSGNDASNLTASADVAAASGLASASGIPVYGSSGSLGAGQSDTFTGYINIVNLADGTPIYVTITIFENGQQIGQGTTSPFAVACPSGTT